MAPTGSAGPIVGVQIVDPGAQLFGQISRGRRRKLGRPLGKLAPRHIDLQLGRVAEPDARGLVHDEIQFGARQAPCFPERVEIGILVHQGLLRVAGARSISPPRLDPYA